MPPTAGGMKLLLVAAILCSSSHILPTHGGKKQSAVRCSYVPASKACLKLQHAAEPNLCRQPYFLAWTQVCDFDCAHGGELQLENCHLCNDTSTVLPDCEDLICLLDTEPPGVWDPESPGVWAEDSTVPPDVWDPEPTEPPGNWDPEPTEPPGIWDPEPTEPPGIWDPEPTEPPGIWNPEPTEPPGVWAEDSTEPPDVGDLQPTDVWEPLPTDPPAFAEPEPTQPPGVRTDDSREPPDVWEPTTTPKVEPGNPGEGTEPSVVSTPGPSVNSTTLCAQHTTEDSYIEDELE